MGQDQGAGRVLRVIELGDEGLQHLCRALCPAGAGVEIHVPPILVRPDEEHLHAGLSPLHMQANDIGLLYALRVDALGGLYDRQRLDPVAQGGGAFKLHRVGGVLHLTRQLGLHLRRLALQEALGVGDRHRVIFRADLADAGRAAPFDLMQQARPGARVKGAVGAVAQQEHLLQLVQSPVHSTRAGEGAEIGALGRFRATVLADHREGMLRRDQDVGEAFVVAQQHVVARFQLLDEVLLQQQRLCLRPRCQEHHRRGFGDHPLDPAGMAGRAGVAGHARLEVARLAHIEHAALCIEHPVHPGRAVQCAQIGLNPRVTGQRLRRRRRICQIRLSIPAVSLI